MWQKASKKSSLAKSESSSTANESDDLMKRNTKSFISQVLSPETEYEGVDGTSPPRNNPLTKYAEFMKVKLDQGGDSESDSDDFNHLFEKMRRYGDWYYWPMIVEVFNTAWKENGEKYCNADDHKDDSDVNKNRNSTNSLRFEYMDITRLTSSRVDLLGGAIYGGNGRNKLSRKYGDFCDSVGGCGFKSEKWFNQYFQLRNESSTGSKLGSKLPGDIFTDSGRGKGFENEKDLRDIPPPVKADLDLHNEYHQYVIHGGSKHRTAISDLDCSHYNSLNGPLREINDWVGLLLEERAYSSVGDSSK